MSVACSFASIPHCSNASTTAKYTDAALTAGSACGHTSAERKKTTNCSTRAGRLNVGSVTDSNVGYTRVYGGGIAERKPGWKAPVSSRGGCCLFRSSLAWGKTSGLSSIADNPFTSSSHRGGWHGPPYSVPSPCIRQARAGSSSEGRTAPSKRFEYRNKAIARASRFGGLCCRGRTAGLRQSGPCRSDLANSQLGAMSPFTRPSARATPSTAGCCSQVRLPPTCILSGSPCVERL